MPSPRRPVRSPSRESRRPRPRRPPGRRGAGTPRRAAGRTGTGTPSRPASLPRAPHRSGAVLPRCSSRPSARRRGGRPAGRPPRRRRPGTARPPSAPACRGRRSTPGRAHRARTPTPTTARPPTPRSRPRPGSPSSCRSLLDHRAPRARRLARRTTRPSWEPLVAPSLRRSGRRGPAPWCAGARAKPRRARSPRRPRHRPPGTPSSRRPVGSACPRLPPAAAPRPPEAGPTDPAAPPDRDARRGTPPGRRRRARGDLSSRAAVSQGRAPSEARLSCVRRHAGLPFPLPHPRARNGDRDGGAVRDRGARARDGLRPRVLHLAGLRAGSPLPFGDRPFAHRVLAPRDGVPRGGALGAHRPRRDPLGASRPVGALAGGPRVPARDGPGGARRRGRGHRPGRLVGDRALRGRPAPDRGRDVRGCLRPGRQHDRRHRRRSHRWRPIDPSRGWLS